MRRAALALVTTVTGLVMLLSFKSHALPASTAPATVAVSGATTSTPSGTSSSASTVTGDAVSTRWGPVQVQVTVASGKVTDVQAVVYPSDNPRDQEINAYALPVLRSEALAAQSAQIDTVSGATVTSVGYLQSLQSALDKAGL